MTVAFSRYRLLLDEFSSCSGFWDVATCVLSHASYISHSVLSVDVRTCLQRLPTRPLKFCVRKLLPRSY